MVQVSVQRRRVGSLDVPARRMLLDSPFASPPLRGDVQWPDRRINFSHWMIGVAMGVRF